jgi:hypothetical protein
MKLRSFIQWGSLVSLVVILLVFEEIHLQVINFNLFLLLLISFTVLEIVCLKILERRRNSLKKVNQQGATKV